MASVNKVILVGHLGADPELRYTGSGTPYCTFRMATSEKREDKETTEWHNIVTWSKLAEICKEYLSKGRLVYIEGKLRYRTYEDKEGNKKWMTEIVAHEMKMLDRATGTSD